MSSFRRVGLKQSLVCVSAILFLLTGVVGLAGSSGAQTVSYDLVLAGGRVIDPATGLDAVRYLAISNGKVAAISKSALRGKEVVDVKGLVVAPGFIDLHAHGQNVFGQTYQVRDGVTTALDLEIGTNPLDALGEREGKALINYGYSAKHTAARRLIKKGDLKATNHETLTRAEFAEMFGHLRQALDEGALGIGVGLDYVSRGVTPDELEALFKLAAERRVPIFIHIRMPEDRQDVSGLKELLDLTEKTKASFHMVHITSTGLGRLPVFLKMIAAAHKKRLM